AKTAAIAMPSLATFNIMTPPRVSTAANKHTDVEVFSNHESGSRDTLAVRNTSFRAYLSFRLSLIYVVVN
ncbi:MAG: hypothetical protein ACREMY_01375, partial [bacterium]